MTHTQKKEPRDWAGVRGGGGGEVEPNIEICSNVRSLRLRSDLSHFPKVSGLSLHRATRTEAALRLATCILSLDIDVGFRILIKSIEWNLVFLFFWRRKNKGEKKKLDGSSKNTEAWQRVPRCHWSFYAKIEICFSVPRELNGNVRKLFHITLSDIVEPLVPPMYFSEATNTPLGIHKKAI